MAKVMCKLYVMCIQAHPKSRKKGFLDNVYKDEKVPFTAIRFPDLNRTAAVKSLATGQFSITCACQETLPLPGTLSVPLMWLRVSCKDFQRNLQDTSQHPQTILPLQATQRKPLILIQNSLTRGIPICHLLSELARMQEHHFKLSMLKNAPASLSMR